MSCRRHPDPKEETSLESTEDWYQEPPERHAGTEEEQDEITRYARYEKPEDGVVNMIARSLVMLRN